MWEEEHGERFSKSAFDLAVEPSRHLVGQACCGDAVREGTGGGCEVREGFGADKVAKKLRGEGSLGGDGGRTHKQPGRIMRDVRPVRYSRCALVFPNANSNTRAQIHIRSHARLCTGPHSNTSSPATSQHIPATHLPHLPRAPSSQLFSSSSKCFIPNSAFLSPKSYYPPTCSWRSPAAARASAPTAAPTVPLPESTRRRSAEAPCGGGGGACLCVPKMVRGT